MEDRLDVGRHLLVAGRTRTGLHGRHQQRDFWRDCPADAASLRSPTMTATSPVQTGFGAGSRIDARSSRSRRRLLVLGAAVAAGAAAGAVYRRRSGVRSASGSAGDDGHRMLGWGDVTRPDHRMVRTPDGAQLAVWDLEGDGPDAPVVVLPHCWGCSHEIWLPVARRLREQGHRVVLYDQRATAPARGGRHRSRSTRWHTI